MKYLSKFLVIISTLLFSLSIDAQTPPCNLGLADAPDIRGIKLGMSPVEVENVLGLKILLEDYKKYALVIEGVKEYRFIPRSGWITPKQLEGIETLFLKFSNNSLYYIFIIYEKPVVEWKDSKEFTSYLSDRFNLPKDSWFKDTHLSCNGFTVSARLREEGETSIILTDDKIDEIIKEREERTLKEAVRRTRAKELEKQKGFKP